MIALLLLSSASAIAGTTASTGSTGGSNASPWQVTVTKDGTDTYIFPVHTTYGYRTMTNSYDWATGYWTLDGQLSTLLAAPPQAKWDFPYALPGSAESRGTHTFKVKWVGTGTPPKYMYFSINSSASAAETEDIIAPSLSGSNGQGDPFNISTVSGLSTGVHAKRLKLNENGEATYTVSVTAKSEKNSLKANLAAGAGIGHSLDPKALGLTKETYERDEINIGTPVVRRIDAGTNDFEKQKAVIGAKKGFEAGWFDVTQLVRVDTVIDISRLGNWTFKGETVESAVSEGERTLVYASNGWEPIGIQIKKDYPISEMDSMRKVPKTITLWAKQSDANSPIPGPFRGDMEIKVWAPVRLRSSYDYINESGWSEPDFLGPNGNSTVRVNLTYVGQTGSLSFSITSTDVFKFPVGLSVGGTIGGDILSFLKATIKLDISKAFGEQQGYNVTGAGSLGIGPCENPVEEWGLEIRTRTHNRDRFESVYNDAGYDSDIVNTILNSQPANIIVRVKKISSGGLQ
jgi:hypothetical protein